MVRQRKANVIPDFGITFHPFGWESQVTRYGYDEEKVRQALQTGKSYKGYIWKYAED